MGFDDKSCGMKKLLQWNLFDDALCGNEEACN